MDHERVKRGQKIFARMATFDGVSAVKIVLIQATSISDEDAYGVIAAKLPDHRLVTLLPGQWQLNDSYEARRRAIEQDLADCEKLATELRRKLRENDF